MSAQSYLTKLFADIYIGEFGANTTALTLKKADHGCLVFKYQIKNTTHGENWSPENLHNYLENRNILHRLNSPLLLIERYNIAQLTAMFENFRNHDYSYNWHDDLVTTILKSLAEPFNKDLI